MPISPRQLKKLAHRDLEEARLIRKRHSNHLSPEQRQELESAVEAVVRDLNGKAWEPLERSRQQLGDLIEKDLAPFRPNQYWETFKALALAVGVALFIRWMFVEPFRIPSGSLIPTLLIGDQLIVNKVVYGPNVPFTTKKLWMPRVPRRGEIVVFRWPKDPKTDYIKRVIGLPGETVEMRDGILYVDGREMPKTYAGPYDGPQGESGCASGPFQLYREQLDAVNHLLMQCPDGYLLSRSRRFFGPVTVEPGHLFVMGDNRDMSSDSRDWGQVPMSHLKGKAMFIHLPLNPQNHYLPRWNRFFRWVH